MVEERDQQCMGEPKLDRSKVRWCGQAPSSCHLQVPSAHQLPDLRPAHMHGFCGAGCLRCKRCRRLPASRRAGQSEASELSGGISVRFIKEAALFLIITLFPGSTRYRQTGRKTLSRFHLGVPVLSYHTPSSALYDRTRLQWWAWSVV